MTYYIVNGEIWATTNPKSVPAGAVLLTPLQYEIAQLLQKFSFGALRAELYRVHEIMKGQG